MSGAEVFGLISSIVAIVDAIVKLQCALHSTSGLPSAFHDVSRRMPLLRETLLIAQEGIDQDAGSASYTALKSVLDSCKEKINSLEKIFRAVVVERDAPKLERYTSAARSSTKGRRVQELMISVQADIQALTGNYAIKTATKMQVEALLAEMTVFRSSKLCGLNASISNHGAGQ